MGLFNRTKNKNMGGEGNDTNRISDSMSKEDLFRMILAQQAQRAPSEHFASGSVFDISRLNRDFFLQVLRTGNAGTLMQLFVQSYLLFLEQPEVVGFPAHMVNRDTDDTNPAEWNADLFRLADGMYAALLYMPVRNDTIDARIVGIIFGEQGDGYYYCMLKKGEATPSDVCRNKAMQGIHKVGEVSGRGFGLMNSFLNCMKNDYFSG